MRITWARIEADSSPFVKQLGWQGPLKRDAVSRVDVRNHYITTERMEQRSLKKALPGGA